MHRFVCVYLHVGVFVSPKVVSPGSPNYLYEGCMRADDISFRESKPYIGIMKDSSGYLLCQAIDFIRKKYKNVLPSFVCFYRSLLLLLLLLLHARGDDNADQDESSMHDNSGTSYFPRHLLSDNCLLDYKSIVDGELVCDTRTKHDQDENDGDNLHFPMTFN